MNFRTIEISDPLFEPKGFRFITVKSIALKNRADVSVFIPESAKGKVRVPVIVLLHGVYGSHWAWTMKGNAHNTLISMIENGESAPFVLVMPSDGLWGDGSGYVSHGIQDFEKWIGEEVPSLMKQTIDEVDADSKIFISGLSMGGYGAFRIGLKFSSFYKGISGHSLITDIAQMKNFVEEDWSFSNGIDGRGIQNLISGMNAIPPARFDCGLDDYLLIPNQELHKFLMHSNIPHEYQEFPGGHNWNYWQDKIKLTYRFFSRLV
ncbi:MAG: alpha/beta hydrolase-fold protein [Bacteroidota bacterium]